MKNVSTKPDTTKGVNKFPEKSLRYLLLYAWSKNEINKDTYTIKKGFLRILLKKLQSKEKTRHLVQCADPDYLGQALYKMNLLEFVSKDEGVFKLKKVLFDRFLKNLDKEEEAFRRSFFQVKECLNPSIKFTFSIKAIKIDGTDLHFCDFCDTNCDNSPEFLSHIAQYHSKSAPFNCWKLCSQELIISLELVEDTLQTSLMITSRNKVLYLQCITVSVVSLNLFCIVLEKEVLLSPMRKFSIPFNRMILRDEEDVYTVAFQLRDDIESTTHVEAYNLEIEGSIDNVLHRARNYMKDALQEKAMPLCSFESDKTFLKCLDDDFRLKEIADKRAGAKYKNLSIYLKNNLTLTPDNYIETLKTLNEIEDLFVSKQLENFFLEERNIKKLSSGLFVIDIEYDELPSSISERDIVLIFPSLAGTPLIHSVEGEIIDLNEDRIIFYSEELLLLSRVQEQFHELLFYVKFRKERSAFVMEQDALSKLEKNVICNMLFVDKSMQAPLKNARVFEPFKYDRFDWVSKSITSNREQMQAIKNIVCKSSYPAPYILFGPPGTGKTTTLVEAVVQIWKQKPHNRILVCAYSNYAVDEIGKRILKFIPKTDCYRFYAQSMVSKRSFLNEDLLETSNLKGRTNSPPSNDELLSYRIVLTTLTNSGWLSLKNFPKNKFDYIFIDECASATEASAIIPIAGLVSMNGPGQVQVVIAGDPKQLGPVVTCKTVADMGLSRSLMERLMQEKFYNPGARGFNPSAFTKLVQNFRSHAAILHVPNKLFYQNELIAKASINKNPIQFKIKPNMNVPVIFHAVTGYCQSDGYSKSLFNLHEILELMNYVYLLLNNGIVESQDIGIVSPYKRQVKEIRKVLLQLGLSGIEVGSVEQFQGREKMVIIISTVRSQINSVGFLANPQRLNVAVTRAQGLLIVVGDATTLWLDLYWRYFIKFCSDNGSFIVSEI